MTAHFPRLEQFGVLCRPKLLYTVEYFWAQYCFPSIELGSLKFKVDMVNAALMVLRSNE